MMRSSRKETSALYLEGGVMLGSTLKHKQGKLIYNLVKFTLENILHRLEGTGSANNLRDGI